MSIYSALSVDVPIITYSVLHQMRKGIEAKAYLKTTQEMHRMVHAETEKINELWKNHLADVSASSVQTTRGTLSQFLTLPLDTDIKEIHRILGEQIGQLLKQTLPPMRLGVVASTEGKFIWEREQNATLRTLLSRGEAYLKKMKFKPAEAGLEIFESDFVVDGGINLDIIEHIVRDRMGIYATAHGHHLEETDAFVFAAHNQVYHQGTPEGGTSKFEAILHFAKGKPQYEEFRKELAKVLDALQKEFHFEHLSVWQRKLGLGAGAEFNVRIRSNEKKTIKDAILAISKHHGKSLVHDPLVEEGHLLLKEIIA